MGDSGKHYIIEAKVPLNLVRNIWIESIYSHVNEGWDETNLILENPLTAEHFQVKLTTRPYDYDRFAII